MGQSEGDETPALTSSPGRRGAFVYEDRGVCMCKKWCALVLSMAAVGAVGAAEPPRLPYTIARETTIITAPLRADGGPDYVAALNEKFGNGIKSADNGYAAFLRNVL